MLNWKKCLVFLLVLVLLVSAVPISVADAAKVQTPEATASAVSVPAISSPYTTHPVVFMVEDTYQIAFATNATGLAWVEINGVKYNDSQNGLMRWNSKYHKVTVPMAALDSAKSYKICFQSLSARPAYDAVPGSTQSRTYPFDPMPTDRDPVFYCSSDQHNDKTYTTSIAKYKSFDVYVLGGDYSGKLTEDTYVKLMLDMAGGVTQGRKPTIYTRGNHEIRGAQSHNLYRVSGYSEETGPYYTIKMPGIFAIVLDAGEDKVDSHEEYGGTVQFSTYRDAQTKWLQEVVASREWEQYPVRMVFSHVPFSFYATDTFESVYSEWTELLDQMGVSIQISGHTHKYGIYGPNATRHKSDPNYTTLIVSDRENGDYTYSSTFVTVTETNYKIENILHDNTVKASKTIPVFTNAYVHADAASTANLMSVTDATVEDVKSATKATVPSISSPYTLHPTVFAVEDGYQIIFTTDTTGMAWIEVGGKKYYDQTTGLMDWETKYHSIRIPRVALDSARSYKTCFQSMTTRAAYSPTHGSTVSRTYPFTPMADKPEPVILCLSDFRSLATEAKAVAKYKTFDALYIGGDYATQGNTEANLKTLLDTASAITTGTKPVIFTRGNREIRGNYSYLLDAAAPTSAAGKSYYTIEQAHFFAIVLDSGEDKLDSNSAYGNTIDYQNFRKEQTQWLKEVLAEGKWKDYPTRIAFVHMPITRNTTAGLKEDFAEWIKILNQMGISLMISGHNYSHTLYASNASGNVGSPNFPTLISCDVDNADYTYSGSYVTLGTDTIKIESVSATKKLLKTSTTKNVTAPTYPASADQYLMFDFNNDSVALDRYHSSVYGGLNFDQKANWDSEANTGEATISRGVLSFSPASETVTSSGIHSRAKNNAKGNWAYRPLHYYTKATDYCQVRFKIDNAVASTTDGTAKFRLDVDCPNDIDPSADVSKTYVRYEQSFKAADVVGKGYVTISFPLNSTAYTSMNWMNLVHPQFVNLKSASGSTAVFSIDYIYIGPQESFPKQDDTLFFDFTDTVEDRDRYNSFTYNYLNFDAPSNWTAYNGSPMSTIEDGVLKLAVPTGNTDTAHSTRSRRDSSSSLHFVPGKNDILQVRIQINNAVATTTDGTSTFRMDLDRSNAIVNAAGTSRTWTNIPITFNLADYVNQGWFVLETKLTDAEYLASDWINLIHPVFANMTNESGKTAEFLIDYIYIGPAEKNPTIKADTVEGYAPTDDSDVLYFGFGNNAEDRDRYKNNSVYGGINYDTSGSVRTQNFLNGSGAIDFPVSGSQTVDNTLGTITTKLNGPYPTESSYTGNVSRRFIFGEANDISDSVGTLQYHPANAEVFQVRFKLDNLKLRSDIDTVDPQARARNIALRYYKDGDTAPTLNTATYGDITENGKYVVVTLPLDSTFTSAEVITKLFVEFHGFVKLDDTKDGYVTLDYVYVGPKSTMPTREDGYLFFDFTDSAAAQYRYANNTYGGINFDRIGNWWDNGDVASKNILGGSLTFTSKSLSNKSWHYLGTGNGDEDSSGRAYPLHYVPSAEDYCEVRFKLDGATPFTEDGHLSFRLEFFSSVNSADNLVTVTKNFSADEVGNGYFTIHFPLGTDEKYIAMSEIVRFNILINSVAYGDVITADIDYLYIGAESTMPTPHIYEEIFTEATCTEDGSKIRTCAECGVTHTDIFPATGHSYEYTNNGADHTKVCACGHTVTENHVFEPDTCVCGETSVKEPVENTSLKINHTLNLASDISVNLVVSKSLLQGFDMDTVYIMTELDVYSDNTKTGTKSIKILPVDQGNYYYFTLTGLTAVHMNDRFRSVLYGKVGS